MNKLLLVLALTASVVMAKPAHKGGGKSYNKGSVHSSLKGANSVVKPNKYKKYDKNFDKSRDSLERDVTNQVIKSVL